MSKKKILFIGGSLNQSTMMYQVSRYFTQYDCYFTPHYGDGYIDFFSKMGMLDFTVLGGNHKILSEQFFEKNNVQVDFGGTKHNYDLIFTSSDLIVQKNIRGKKVILVQEGMTDPENIFFYLAKYLKFPRYLASTSTTGLSDEYNYFCVASEGYKNLFAQKGANPSKIIVTGIPNFDNAKQYLNNDFPYHNYVLAATSDSRETFKYENRKKFILNALNIANGRQLIFKLHPNENFDRATKEINLYAPGSIVFNHGNTNHMIANSEALITRFSSVVFIGLALDKEVYSDFDINLLKQLLPMQNGGKSSENIAKIGYKLLEEKVYYFNRKRGILNFVGR